MNFKSKYTIIIIVALASLISFLFLPLISVLGFTASFFELLSLGTSMGFSLGIMDILGIAALIGIIVSAFVQKKTPALICSIVATLYCIAFIGAMAEGASGMDIMGFLGIGFWIALVGSIINIVLSAVADK